ncbi:class I SAM-dependent RNA methyltransferase [Nereida sp. MMG025]|uniref:class I SAM-dependent RNA methyltransferase n=1 Tax=Nereida sp. MMG025 TaxID=2909981 RepID=UPI001F384634|nr:class I SAM-dependent RNA methyltransferase [Nereida sp. MMG025]MCF6444599.1 class I SAM-dependent RNA methyltransferase [Nereida sp. MMG025]
MTQYKIERLNHHGKGVAEGPVFVPRVLPGELVTGRLNGTDLEDVKVLTPSSDRVRAPCRHYNACGGCALQHASDAFVENWKAQAVQTALAANGISIEIPKVFTSNASTRRRAKLSGRRTKSGAIVGFHARGSNTVVEIPDCTVLAPEILAALPMLGDVTKKVCSRKGEIQFQVTVTVNGLDVLVLGAREVSAIEQAELAAITRSFGIARLTWGNDLLAGENPAAIPMGAALVTPPPGSFLQATQEGERALVEFVRHHAGSAKRAVDLFAGSGTFSFPMAETCDVHAVEGDRAMMDAVDAGWRQSKGLHKVTTETRDLFRRPLMADELRHFDCAVIDPPRAGAEAQIKHIAESDLETVVMISCNPVTFSRDAKHLVAAGFTLENLNVVDQFRWSPHIEIAANFSR